MADPFLLFKTDRVYALALAAISMPLSTSATGPLVTRVSCRPMAEDEWHSRRSARRAMDPVGLCKTVSRCSPRAFFPFVLSNENCVNDVPGCESWTSTNRWLHI
ncbi:hypothetical protein C8Q70DRAFT_390136 [Cubamyces menziesii]|nr:hypothetical protein C8Q70DRAFT_390136 [Cubamyces menziesii]